MRRTYHLIWRRVHLQGNVHYEKKVLRIRIEPELSELIDSAIESTGLSKSELLREGLRKGVPEVVRALGRHRERR